MQDDHIQLAVLTSILTRMETKVDKALEDHEKRIRSVERRQWINYGAIAASLGTAGALVKHLVTRGQ